MAGNARSASLFRKLPSVDDLLRDPAMAGCVRYAGHAMVAHSARVVLERLRDEIADGTLDEEAVGVAVSGLAQAVERQVQASVRPSLRAVINATGVVLHTNLGRAPVSRAALAHLADIAGSYSNLEFDLSTGQRGRRDVHVQPLLQRLLGDATASIVVNNNAAAVLLALNTLAEGGEVIVSRGELVEIGGSFRIPDVMARSGALLREVGTTNRTRIADYEKAITDRTRLLLRVHRSNFQITGFTEQPSLAQLVELGRARGVPVIEDLGSGALLDLRVLGIAGEPSVSSSIRAGVDLVTYSGDKLLGGPQAGLLTGRPELIARIRRNPLFRALRVDKLTYAALAATLLAYLREDGSIPAIAMMRLGVEEIAERARALQRRLGPVSGLTVELVPGKSMIGGGAAPGTSLATMLLAVTHDVLAPEDIVGRLRESDPPVVARIEDGRVLLDFRTVFPEQDSLVEHAMRQLAQSRG
jgi:L-seryl-tRNA(Ser) seleniumtransferase